MYSNKENVNILTALLVEYGVYHVVVCPGSRNAPLVHNFNECPDIECHPVTDERSAAFVAVGIRLQTRCRIAVCVTSGSALLNTLPGAAEASYQKQGIIIISADRPAEWIGQLDGQTMPQPGALGSFVEKSVQLPECKDEEERWHCRRLICEAINANIKTGKSVHINIPITEPLFQFTEPELPMVDNVDLMSWNQSLVPMFFMTLIGSAYRPMIVIGQSARGMVNDDVLSRLRSTIVTLAEPLSVNDPSPSLDDVIAEMGADIEDYKPDFVFYLGSTTISKRLRQFLRTVSEGCEVVMHNNTLELEDPTCHASYMLEGDASQILIDLSTMFDEETYKFAFLFKDEEFLQRWNTLQSAVREKNLNTQPDTLEAKAVKVFESMMTTDDNVFYANSTAIRLAARYAHHYVYCNRGLNGIEGSLSTAVGASLATDKKVYCVIGDLSFFYDQNALWNTELHGNLRILLLNDGGGKIFSTLPGLKESAAISYISAQHDVKAEAACRQYNIHYKSINSKEDLNEAIDWLTTSESDRPLLLEINV